MGEECSEGWCVLSDGILLDIADSGCLLYDMEAPLYFGLSAIFERDRMSIAVMSGPATEGGSLVADAFSRLSTQDTYSDGSRTSSRGLIIVWRRPRDSGSHVDSVPRHRSSACLACTEAFQPHTPQPGPQSTHIVVPRLLKVRLLAKVLPGEETATPLARHAASLSSPPYTIRARRTRGAKGA